MLPSKWPGQRIRVTVGDSSSRSPCHNETFGEVRLIHCWSAPLRRIGTPPKAWLHSTIDE